VNILNDWIHALSQTNWVKDKDREFELVINNKTIPYSYVKYIY